MVHASAGDCDGVRPRMAGPYHVCTRQSSSGLQVNDLKVTVTPSSLALVLGVSVSCTLVHLLSQRDARLRPLLDVALALDTSQGYAHHWDTVDGLPSRDRYRRACLRQIGGFSQIGAT